MENLGRGVVALRTTATQVLVSWRVLGTDPSDMAFNLYRSTNGGPPGVLFNGAPLTGATQFIDSTADLTQSNSYFVRPIIFGVEQPPSASFTVACKFNCQCATISPRATTGASRRNNSGWRQLHLQRKRLQRRRSRRRRRIRDHREVGSFKLAGQLNRWLHWQRLYRRIQTGRHQAVADRSWPKHSCRGSLHAVHRLRSRWRRKS